MKKNRKRKRKLEKEEEKKKRRKKKLFLLKLRNTDTSTFWIIYDCLLDDLKKNPNNPNFWYKRDAILKYFIDEKMYVIADSSIKCHDSCFCNLHYECYPPLELDFVHPIHSIPGFITYDKDDFTATNIWIRKDYRHKGYGTHMIKQLRINHVWAVKQSVNFWKKNGFEILETNGRSVDMKLKCLLCT